MRYQPLAETSLLMLLGIFTLWPFSIHTANATVYIINKVLTPSH